MRDREQAGLKILGEGLYSQPLAWYNCTSKQTTTKGRTVIITAAMKALALTSLASDLTDLTKLPQPTEIDWYDVTLTVEKIKKVESISAGDDVAPDSDEFDALEWALFDTALEIKI